MALAALRRGCLHISLWVNQAESFWHLKPAGSSKLVPELRLREKGNVGLCVSHLPPASKHCWRVARIATKASPAPKKPWGPDADRSHPPRCRTLSSSSGWLAYSLALALRVKPPCFLIRRLSPAGGVGGAFPSPEYQRVGVLCG